MTLKSCHVKLKILESGIFILGFFRLQNPSILSQSNNPYTALISGFLFWDFLCKDFCTGIFVPGFLYQDFCTGIIVQGFLYQDFYIRIFTPEFYLEFFIPRFLHWDFSLQNFSPRVFHPGIFHPRIFHPGLMYEDNDEVRWYRSPSSSQIDDV